MVTSTFLYDSDHAIRSALIEPLVSDNIRLISSSDVIDKKRERKKKKTMAIK